MNDNFSFARLVYRSLAGSACWIPIALLATAVVCFPTSLSGQTNTFPSSGNVGIGTTSPTGPLDVTTSATMGGAVEVHQDANITSLGAADAQLRIHGLTNTNLLMLLGFDTTNNYGMIQAATYGVRYNNMAINPFGGMVGIGTTNPTAPLHIANNAPEGSPYIGQLLISPVSTGQYYREAAITLQTTFASGRMWTIMAGSGTPNTHFRIFDSTAAVDRLNIDESGRVGIGTVSPGYQLDVQQGQVNSSGGYCIAGSCITSWPSATANTWTSAQTFNGTTTFTTSANFVNGTWSSSGNVGIGTTSPGSASFLTPASGYTTALDVMGPIRAQSGIVSFETANPTGDPTNYGAVLYNKQGVGPTMSGYMFTVRTGNSGAPTTERLRVDQNGNVGVGTTAPQHMLHVAGVIGAEEVIVSATGADYVFEPDYHLSSLDEVATYIKKNHRLPGVPSAAETQSKGLSLGEMQLKLLAKIEELTLHMIQAEERNRELQERIARLEARVAGDRDK